MKTNNPMFSTITAEHDIPRENAASYKGVTVKTVFLLGVSILSAVLTGIMLFDIKNYSAFYTMLIVSSIVGFISVMIGRNSPRLSKYFGVIYAVCEGLFLGTLTVFGELLYPGVAAIAVISTIVIFGVMLGLFATGVIRNSSKLFSIAMGVGISLISLTIILMLLQTFSTSFSTFLSNNIGLVIVLELFFLAYGAIMLLVNFSEVTYYVKAGASKNHEWVAAFGLMVSIIYIYIEILRLLILIMGRRD